MHPATTGELSIPRRATRITAQRPKQVWVVTPTSSSKYSHPEECDLNYTALWRRNRQSGSVMAKQEGSGGASETQE
ncbi:hypothetical protein E2C01_015915 [Portunus trituberculatus]|uniref:Uncharacterized protein n=1 Tax=Portunus trituberculatus TaxID=210409 RepID=A0A5B7DP66_PORTR|nr:hypothetical protein [Portunus trituberculatus]